MGASLSAPGRQPFSFSGKHVFITGGANGIGLSMIKLMLKRGARVTFTDIADSSTALSQFNTLIKTEQLPGQVWFFKADVGVYEQMTSSIQAAEEKLGPIDCLIPNAGIASGGTNPDNATQTLVEYHRAGLFLDESVEDLERVQRVNYLGVLYTLKAGLPGMLQRRSGVVLMMSSMMAMFAGFCASAYVAPKAGVLSLANALRLELLGTGVDITIAMPAFTDTAMRTVGLENPRSPSFAKQLTQEMKVYSPDVVAELALQGVEKGYFFARSPDFASNLAIASMAGVAPRIYNGLIEFLLLPIYFLLHMVVRRSVDARILKWRREEQSAKGTVSVKSAKLKDVDASAVISARKNKPT